MAYRENRMGLLVRLDPAAAAGVIDKVMRESGGSVHRAAGHLKESSRSLRRWLDLLQKRGFYPVKPEVVEQS